MKPTERPVRSIVTIRTRQEVESVERLLLDLLAGLRPQVEVEMVPEEDEGP